MVSRRTLLSAAAAAAVFPRDALALEAVPFALPPELEPQRVRIRDDAVAGNIYVLPQTHFLYFVEAPGQAVRFGVGVGIEGLNFRGEAVIGAKKEWPSWRPTDEMIERNPEQYAQYADGMPGGPENPLGARALYLFQNGYDTFFRIHGTTQPDSIGRSVSNGCIRMLNSHVAYLYDRVPLGTTVVVY